MTELALPGAALAVCLLLALALVSPFLSPKMRARVVAWGCVVPCAVTALLAACVLIGGGVGTLAVPLGPAGAGMVLALDGLSAFFLLLLMLVATAASGSALDGHAEPVTAPFLPLFIAAMALTLLAADAFSLMLGWELMSVAAAALVLTGHRDPDTRAAALLFSGMAILGAVCLFPALGLLAQGGGQGGAQGGIWDWRFASMRAHPPEGLRASAVLLLALIGAGSKAGLAPLHVWLPPAHANAPGHVSALMSGAMTKIALYVLVRLVFDLCGPAQPLWWGLPLMLLGVAGAVLGGLRANVEGDIKSVLACSTIENVGLIAVGFGLALLARAADLPPLAALAMGGALLHAIAHAMFKSLLFLGAGAVQHGARTRRLDRLGGLVHTMPITTACVMAGAACAAGLPPSAGFAGEWMLFQAALAAARVGGLGVQVAVVGVATLMVLAAALAAAAAVRLVGIAFLGRPRSPLAAGAEEVARPAHAAMVGLGIAALLIGLLPGWVLVLAQDPVHRFAGGLGGVRDAALVVAPAADAPGYAAPAIAVLLGLAAIAVAWAMRRWAVPGMRRGPAWDCGFGAPPPWLPFGDPATQYGGASFGQPLRRSLGAGLLAAREAVDMPEPGETRPAQLTVTLHDPAEAGLFAPAAALRDRLSVFADRMQLLNVRATLSVMFAVLVLFLAAISVIQQW